MSHYSQTKKQDVDNINDQDFFEAMSNESCELFKRALSDAADSEIRKFEKEAKDMEMPAPSKRHKIRMNRLFRECVGGAFIPFPEVDNFYEKARSKLIVNLNINEFLDRCEKHRQGK